MSFHSSFALVPLGDVARFINGDRSTNYPKGGDYVDDGTPFISAADLDEGRVEYSSVRRISTSAYERLRSGKIQKDDVLFCLRGSIGKIACIKEHEVGAIASSLVIVRATENIDPQYLFFGLSSQAGQQAALGLNNGAAQPNLSVGELQKIRLPLPSLPIQSRIAGILSAYDELIENSQRRIKILESMARALYREWFVHFRFPGHESVPRIPSPLGEIPNGWKVKKLGDVAEVTMGLSPKGNTYNEDGDGTPLVNGPVEFGERFTKQVKWTTAPTKFCKEGDLVVCVRGSTTGKYVKSDGEYCLGRGVCGISSKYQCFVDLLFENELPTLLGQTSGSTFPSWTGPQLKSHPVLSPPSELLADFVTLVKPMSAVVLGCSRKIQNLRLTRDLLLPRLLSGQIDVEAIAS